MAENKVVNNAKWIVICKIVQSLIQLLIGMISARYLGPSNYGLINYAASLVGFAAPIMQLGLSSTLVQEYVERQKDEGAIAGTSLGLNLISGMACMIGVTCFAAVANQGEKITVAVCGLYSISLLFQATEMLQYWFQARLLSKHSSLAMLAGHVAMSVYKVFLLISGRSVHWFALAHTVEYSIASLLFIIAYKRLGGGQLSFSLRLAREMLKRSKHYILANLMVMAFQNTSSVMLKLFVGDAEVGYYTTAVTCIATVQFVYSAIVDSCRPVILESRTRSQIEFEGYMTALYSGIFYLTLAQSVVFSFLAKPIVLILYGEEYLAAVSVLRIIVWQVPFSFMGWVRNVWILAEEQHSMLWLINLCGAIANLLLNAVMIPLWGACGAALASVLTQIFTNVVMGFILKPIRPNNRLMLKGLDPRCLTVFLKKRK